MNLADLAQGPPLITVEETVAVLGGRVKRSALHECIARGDFPPARRLGRKILVSVPALLTWLGADPPADGNAPAADRGETDEIRSARGTHGDAT